MELWSLLFEIVVLLGVCLLFGGLFSHFEQGPLVGYLLAGMLLGGPGSLQVVQSQRDIDAIAELGVSLLLFSLGLEFSVSRLLALGRRPLLGGALQVVATWMVGAGVGIVAGLPTAEAIAVGAMVSLSSTAVVLRILMERAEIDTAHGRNGLAVLLVQDIAVIPLAVVMGLLGGTGSLGDVAANVGRIVGMAGVLVVSLYLLLNKVAVAVLGRLNLQRNRELTVILSVVTGLGSTIAAHEVGISPALGAFVAGMFLGASPFATQIRADVSSFRVVLLTLFFGAAGMVADPLWILKNAHLVVGVLLLLIVGKTLIVWGIFRALGVVAPVAAATGICLAQIGEFAFVLGKIAEDHAVISESTYLLVVSVAIVSLFTSPFLVPKAGRLGAWLASRVERLGVVPAVEKTPSRLPPMVVIMGFGPAGQAAARAFEDCPERVVVIDLNREGIRNAQDLGFRGYVGDATQLDVLEHVDLARAIAVVVTVPHHQSALTILQHVRGLAPAAHCVVRSRYERHTHELVTAGAHAVFGDEEQIGGMLGRHLRAWMRDSEESAPPSGETEAVRAEDRGEG